MVEVAPGSRGQKLVVPAFKYVLALLALAVLGILALSGAASLRIGSENGLLEGIKPYLPAFGTPHIELAPKNDFDRPLMIIGLKRINSDSYRVFFSAQNKNGKALDKLKLSQVSLTLLKHGRPFSKIALKSLKPLKEYANANANANANTAPISLAALIDNSGSVLKSDSESAVKNFEELFNNITTPYEAVVYKFGSGLNKLQGLTGDKTLLASAIKKSASRGQTALYDAVCEATNEIAQKNNLGIVVLTADGTDNKSVKTLQETTQLCLERGISVFAFGFGWVNADNLTQLSQKSGGCFAYAPKAEELKQWFNKLADIINNAYTLEFLADLDINSITCLQIGVDSDAFEPVNANN